MSGENAAAEVAQPDGKERRTEVGDYGVDG
jgi:hypothetical protein